ncbi:hypothetical protein [Streptomyces sp. NPDC051219]|uniref:hypothetical protein n=1 Tax=Streptomyces sp. NPDC051219 TaxID=3155283 RepID=UPI003428E15B
MAVLLAGAALGFWIVFGSPHQWEGGLRLLRLALGMTALGLISGSAWLMFPDGPRDDEELTTRQDSTAGTGPGPLDV